MKVQKDFTDFTSKEKIIISSIDKKIIAKYIDYLQKEDINNVSHAITDYLVKSNQLSLPSMPMKE